jgi:hypothetical protein
MTDAQKPKATFVAPLFLFITSTLIAELLIGSTPLSRINTLLFQFPYYGSAALVIREIVLRLRLSRAGLGLLGVAFGLVTEGLALQSVFNPHFLNLDIAFGRAGDVNWPWALYMVGYHAVWSITIPVMLAGLVFPGRRDEPWLGRITTGAFLLLFVLMTFAFHAIFVKMSGFRAPTGPYAVAAVIAAALVVIALRLKRRGVPALVPQGRVWLAGIMMFGSGLFWLMLYGEIFRHPHVVPAAWNLMFGILVAAGFASSISRWAPEHGADIQRFWLVAGGLAANTLFGFVVVSGSPLDTGGQIAVALLVATGLFALGRKLRTNPQG